MLRVACSLRTVVRDRRLAAAGLLQHGGGDVEAFFRVAVKTLSPFHT
jgi:hypothetical protein